jgi:DNA-binding NarL/FixJ family response regulator
MAVAAPTVLIAARSGPLRDSLKLFLVTLPRACRVLEVGDPDELAAALVRNRPELVLVDHDLPADGIESLIHQAGDEASGCRWLVLVDSPEQQQQALAAGADVAMLKGMLARKLFGTIERLLARSQGDLPERPLDRHEACGQP